LIPSPRANRPAASSRSRSRRCCSAGVYPPRCAYRIPRSYARSQPTSRPKLYEFNLGSSNNYRSLPIRRCRWIFHDHRTRGTEIPDMGASVPNQPGGVPRGNAEPPGEVLRDGRAVGVQVAGEERAPGRVAAGPRLESSIGSLITVDHRPSLWRANNHERSVRALAGGAELHCDQHGRHRWPAESAN
jgi:hypothetical protein